MNVTFFWQVLSTLREFKKWKSFQKIENWTTLLNQVSLKPIFACAKLMRIFIYLSLHWISGIWLYMTEKVLHICFWDILWSNGAKRFQITLLNFNELFLTEASASGFSTSKRQNTVAWGGVLFDTDFSSRSESETRAFFSWFHVGTTIASQPYLFIARLTKAKSGNRMNTQRLKPLDAFAFFPSFLSIKNSLFRA